MTVDVKGTENERVGGNASPGKDDKRMLICCEAMVTVISHGN